MTIYSKTYNHNIPAADCGNRCVFVNQAIVPIALVAADKVRPVLIPAGTKVDRVVIFTEGDLDSGAAPALTATIGFEHADGSTGASLTAIAADGANALQTASAKTTYEIFPPVTVAKDSHLVLVCGTGANAQAASCTVHAKVEGECLGAA